MENDKTLIADKKSQIEELTSIRDKITSDLATFKKEVNKLEKDVVAFETQMETILALKEDEEIDL